MINFFARLQDGEAAREHYLTLLRQSTLPNLLGNGPPFQIDGNFGGSAGLAEMLLQSHERVAGSKPADQQFVLHLLPALPKAWAGGSVRGLRARGNFTVDITWANGRVTDYRITSTEPREVRVRVNGEVQTRKAERPGHPQLGGVPAGGSAQQNADLTSVNRPGAAASTAVASFAGEFAGDWLADDGSGGTLKLTVKAKNESAWTVEASFTLEDANVSTTTKKVQIDGSKFETVFAWEMQGAPASSKLVGELKGDQIEGTFESTTPEGVEKGKWKVTR